jgi:hypothetical protein
MDVSYIYALPVSFVFYTVTNCESYPETFFVINR